MLRVTVIATVLRNTCRKPWELGNQTRTSNEQAILARPDRGCARDHHGVGVVRAAVCQTQPQHCADRLGESGLGNFRPTHCRQVGPKTCQRGINVATAGGRTGGRLSFTHQYGFCPSKFQDSPQNPLGNRSVWLSTQIAGLDLGRIAQNPRSEWHKQTLG